MIQHTADIPAWIALFAGLYALSASIGEFVHPGGWGKMAKEVTASYGLRFVIGIMLIALGAAVYLVTPWMPSDWLSVVITALGGLMVLEGCAMLAFGHEWMKLAGGMLTSAGRIWAALSGIIGLALIAAALLRLY
ncbi:hypothetical protein N8940_01955 [Sphingomonadaceae bacterium]|nr:hypothetical protein [Sphingomonadaceae bacterium]